MPGSRQHHQRGHPGGGHLGRDGRHDHHLGALRGRIAEVDADGELSPRLAGGLPAVGRAALRPSTGRGAVAFCGLGATGRRPGRSRRPRRTGSCRVRSRAASTRGCLGPRAALELAAGLAVDDGVALLVLLAAHPGWAPVQEAATALEKSGRVGGRRARPGRRPVRRVRALARGRRRAAPPDAPPGSPPTAAAAAGGLRRAASIPPRPPLPPRPPPPWPPPSLTRLTDRRRGAGQPMPVPESGSRENGCPPRRKQHPANVSPIK